MRRAAGLAGVVGVLALGTAVATTPAVSGDWTPTLAATVISDSGSSRMDLALGTSTHGEAVALWSELGAGFSTSLLASVRSVGGVWGAPQQLDTGPGGQAVQNAHVLIDSSGFATAMWIRKYPSSPNKLWFATRPAAGAWSATTEVTLASPPEGLRVAMKPNGAMTATWQAASGAIWAADKAQGGTSWTLSQVSSSGSAPAVAAAPDNRTAIAWGSSTDLLKVKVRSGSGSWADVDAETGSVNRPETSGVDAARDPVIAFGADDTLHAAWREYADGGVAAEERVEQIRTSSRTEQGAWTIHPEPISSDSATNRPQAIAGDDDGNVTVVWSGTQTPAGGVQTRYWANTRADGAWESPYLLTGSEVGPGSEPRLVVSSAGMFTVAWAKNSMAVHVNRRLASGTWLSAPQVISGPFSSSVRLVNDSAGDPILLWMRFSLENASIHYRIETRRYDPELPPGDVGGPTTAMKKPAKRVTLKPTISLAWSATDPEEGGVGDSRVWGREADWNGGFPSEYSYLTPFGPATSFSYPVMPGHTYCFQAQSLDHLGKPGDWSADRCTATPVDERAAHRSGKWSDVHGLKLYRETALKTTDRGAKLVLNSAQGKRIALVVTKCRGCGKVSVKHAGVLLGKFSLNATSTRNRVLIPVTTYPDVHVGKLVVKVISGEGKKVQIDGILVGRV